MSWEGLCYLDDNLQIINEVNGQPVTTLNLNPYYVNNRAQRWVLVLPLEPALIGDYKLGKAVAEMFAANYAETKTITMPQVLGDIPDTSGIIATGLAGSTQITLARPTPLFPGTFVRFNNHTKVYIIRSGGTRQYQIYPALFRELSGGTAIITEPAITVRQVTGNFSVSIFRGIARMRMRVAEVI